MSDKFDRDSEPPNFGYDKPLQTGIQARRLGASLAFVVAVGAIFPAHAGTIRAGTIDATLTTIFSPAPPAHSTVSCYISLLGSDSTAPTDTKSISAAVTGTRATCHIVMHYRWTLNVAATKMAIVYSVTGPTQSSSAAYRTIPVPANGTTTKFAVVISQ